jgi:hypothetical protein
MGIPLRIWPRLLRPQRRVRRVYLHRLRRLQGGSALGPRTPPPDSPVPGPPLRAVPHRLTTLSRPQSAAAFLSRRSVRSAHVVLETLHDDSGDLGKRTVCNGAGLNGAYNIVVLKRGCGIYPLGMQLIRASFWRNCSGVPSLRYSARNAGGQSAEQTNN